MVVYKNVEQIVRDMIKWVIGIGSTVTDWSIGTPNRQVIEGAASEVETVNFQIKLLEKASSLQTATGADLENKVGDYTVERLTNQKSTTQLRFYVDPLNYVATDVNIPIGYQVQAKNGVNYETIASALFKGSANVGGPQPLDADVDSPTYGKRILDGVPIRALEVGEGGDNGKQEIDQVINPISGIDGFINMSPAVGGFSVESDERLRSRALRQLSSRSHGIRDAHESWAFESDKIICANFENDGGVLNCKVNNGNWQSNCYDGTYQQCDQFTRHDRVLRARAVGRIRGTGTTDVYIVADESGGIPPAWLIERIQDYLTLKAPLGTDIRVYAQTFVGYRPVIEVEKTEEFSGAFYNSSLKSTILQNLVSYYSYAKWNYGTDLLLTDLREVIGSLRGVYDYRINNINGNAPANIVLTDSELPKLTMISSDITLVEFGGL
ncbi:MAG TPA: baseplate J/gp47 family protein [Anaerolineae bacterium]|nr:baseplate J/gp47 family protein [Anaerolineae bacterium]